MKSRTKGDAQLPFRYLTHSEDMGIVSFAFLVLEVLLIARAVLDWSLVLAGPTAPGSLRSKLVRLVHAVTEPLLAPIRRALPPVRFGTVAIDLAFIVLFVGILVVRGAISAFF